MTCGDNRAVGAYLAPLTDADVRHRRVDDLAVPVDARRILVRWLFLKIRITIRTMWKVL
jgi:hypothetical protein